MLHVGQKVVCIGTEGTPGIDWDAWAKHWKIIRPKRGLIYTVRHTRMGKEQQHIRISEIVNPIIKFADAPDQEPWWWASGFRPIIEPKTDISVFTAMLNGAPVEQPAKEDVA